MVEKYRVRVKRGDKEYEVESTNKDYVDSKLKEIMSNVESESAKSEQSHLQQQKNRRRKKGGVSSKNLEEQASETVDIVGIVNHIKDSNDYNKIETNVLDEKQNLPRILMCMYYANEYKEGIHLTTGHVEAITDQMGVKITKSNAGNKIKNNQKYFNSKNARKKGHIVYYKLSRAGEKKFLEILESTGS